MTVKTDIDFGNLGIDLDEPEEGTLVQSRSARYSPKECVTPDGKHIPFQGYLVAQNYHPKPENPKRAFYDLVFRLTKPSVGMAGSGSEKKLVKLEAGDTMLMAATYAMKRWIDVASRENPVKIFELWVNALEEKDIGDDQTVWDYKIRVMGEEDAEKVFSASALLAEKPQAAALTGGTVPAGNSKAESRATAS